MAHTTAFPFRLPGNRETIACVYCEHDFEEPAEFRLHMESEHQDFDAAVAFECVKYENFGKIDITECRCRLCYVYLDTLPTIIGHLNEEHELEIDMDFGLQLHPYKLSNKQYICGICDINFLGIRQLGKHFSEHYPRYTCAVCGQQFANSATLHRHHIMKHMGKKYPCQKCLRSFETIQERRVHINNTKDCWNHRCQICGDRFILYQMKVDHLVEVHGHERKTFPCTSCNKVFNTSSTLRMHYRSTHASNFVCSYCDKKFATRTLLENHVVTHTKEKKFNCTQCDKLFPRKKSLDQHMLTHSEVKRFACTVCGRQFNRKMCMKKHLKSFHLEVYMQQYPEQVD